MNSPHSRPFIRAMKLDPARVRSVLFRFAASAFVVAGLSACNLLPKPSPDPTRHYVLTPPAATSAEPAAARGGLVVGLRAVQVAPYLDTKSMIVRRGENEILYRDYARWAEPLAAGVQRALAGRLRESGRVARLLPQPYPFDVERDVDVAVTVLRCEGRLAPAGATAELVCAIEVLRVGDQDGGGAEVLLRETFAPPAIAWTEGDHAGLAAALGAHVAALADRLVAALPVETPAGE